MLKFKAMLSSNVELNFFIAQVSYNQYALFADEEIACNRVINGMTFCFNQTAPDHKMLLSNIVEFCEKFSVTFTEKQLKKLEAKLEKIYA